MTKLTTRKSTSIKLTDTQLIVLSRAVQREDGAATLPDGMTEKAPQKLAATLVEKALVREIRAEPGMPVWAARFQETRRDARSPWARPHRRNPFRTLENVRQRLGAQTHG